jgi:hypothetical protein
MGKQVNLLVLANSKKPGGRCLAGRLIEKLDDGWKTGPWCRPVCPDDKGRDAIPESACGTVNPMDVISLELGDDMPADGQPENCLWMTGTPISIMHAFNKKENALRKLVECPENLWLDPDASRPDEVSSEIAIDHSLVLIQPANLRFELYFDDSGRKRIQAYFAYNGGLYERIPVTDPLIFRILSRQFIEGEHKILSLNHGDNYWLTMSISLPFGPRQCRYKFVAAVIDHTGYLQREYR